VAGVRPLSTTRRWAFLDIETTGLDPARDELLELGLVFAAPGSLPTEEHRWLVRPSGPIPLMIQALTGLSTADFAHASDRQEALSGLRAALAGVTVVAHNASFERSFLGSVLDGVDVVDSCEVLQLAFPELASHALDALVRWAGLGPGARHRALDDANDTLAVVRLARTRWSAADTQALVDKVAPAESAEAQARVDFIVAWLTGTGAPPPPGPSALSAARAQASGRRLWSVPRALLREAASDEAVLGPTPIDAARLKALCRALSPRSEPLRLACASLSGWVERGGRDACTASGWMRARLPPQDSLLALSAAAPGAPGPGVTVVAHEQLPEALGQAPDAEVVIFDVSALLRALTHRETEVLSPRALHAFARTLALCAAPAERPALLDAARDLDASAHELERTLARHAGAVTPAEPTAPALGPAAWLELRDAVRSVERDLTSLLAQLHARPLPFPFDAVGPQARALVEVLERAVAPVGAERVAVLGGTPPALSRRGARRVLAQTAEALVARHATLAPGEAPTSASARLGLTPAPTSPPSAPAEVWTLEALEAWLLAQVERGPVVLAGAWAHLEQLGRGLVANGVALRLGWASAPVPPRAVVFLEAGRGLQAQVPPGGQVLQLNDAPLPRECEALPRTRAHVRLDDR
jgi:hypothetical protein